MDKREEQGSEVKNTKKSSDRMQDIFKTLAMLRKKYPKVFKKNPEPLKLGISDDLFKDLGEKISKSQIRNALRYYTNSVEYYQAVMASKFRIDLKGNKHSLIEEKHKLFAQKQLGERLLKKQK